MKAEANSSCLKACLHANSDSIHTNGSIGLC
ncbi:hypothetical protein KP509_01G088100 [Ceratopteris richardii]|uniref:Uncharacterized protein n=1 Tax=Ceratopteris richardii TaxID=49495 RepID=A0A8T2VIX5_CERRI|nr:hypothetical protein KP509_01G088100 [Ceratopteris richardii]